MEAPQATPDAADRSSAVLHSVRGLWMVLWGILFVLVDFTTGGGAHRFDLINDFVGALLIAAGVFRVADAIADQRYRSAMAVLKPVVCVYALIQLFDQFGDFKISPAMGAKQALRGPV